MSISLAPLSLPMIETSRALAEREVHIWRLDINQFTAAHYAAAAQIMSANEHERAAKFVRGKESYIASRWLQRKVLTRYTGVAPEALEFLRDKKGKPYLPQRDIHFSLSHSGHWALLAVSNTELIGVDVEVAGNSRDVSGIAEHYYHPQEFARLTAFAGNTQTDYFYRLWTLKEAFFKALGTGISAGLEKIAFELASDSIEPSIAPSINEDKREWHFHQWTLGAQNYAALAYKNPTLLTPHWFDALAAPAFP